MNFMEVGPVVFPQSLNVDINMLPFVLGDPDSVPPEFRHYWPLVEACGIEADESGRVGYLSVMETDVAAGRTQRRPGLHTDAPSASVGWGGGWGRGHVLAGHRRQGIYLASTVAGSCRLWDLRVAPDGRLGACSDALVAGHAPVVLAPNVAYWITDLTPHESVPLAAAAHRQWMRVVTSPVGVWYAAHSTPNRLGVMPHAPVVHGDKFVPR